MKHLLLLIGICLASLLLPAEGNREDGRDTSGMTREAVMEERNATQDYQHRLEAIGNDLKGSQCLTPRRVFQPTSQLLDLRLSQQAGKLLQSFRLRQEEGLSRLSCQISSRQSTYLTALAFRMARQVFALRKLVI